MDKEFLTDTLTTKANDAEDTWETSDKENPEYSKGPASREKELIAELTGGDSTQDKEIATAVTTIFTRFDQLLCSKFPESIKNENECYLDLFDWLKENLVISDNDRWEFECENIIWEIQYESVNVSNLSEFLTNLERYATWESRDEQLIKEWGIYENSSEVYAGLVSLIEAFGEFLESEFDLDGLLEESLEYNKCCGYYYEKHDGLSEELLPKYGRCGSYDTFEEAKKHQIEELLDLYPDYYDEDYEDLDIDEIAQRLILKDENGKFYVERPGSKDFWEAISSDDE